MEARRGDTFTVDEFARQIVEEEHVAPGAAPSSGSPATMAIAVASREDFVKVLVGPPVAVHTEAVGRVETEVVRLLQIRRTVELSWQCGGQPDHEPRGT